MGINIFKNKIFISTIVTIGIFFVLVTFNGNDNTPKSNTIPTFANISQDIDSGAATLLDVRTPQEFKISHFDGALNLNVEDIERGILPQVSKNNKIYVYCRSGNRSAQAVNALKKAGYTNVVDLGGLSQVEGLGGKLNDCC